jgi:hypothetical protein
MDTNEQNEPPSADELPRQLVIPIIGETVLERVHQIAQSIQEKIVRLLADESHPSPCLRTLHLSNPMRSKRHQKDDRTTLFQEFKPI